MKNYAQIKDGKIWNVIVVDESMIDQYRESDDAKRFESVVEVSDGAQIGWLWDGSSFTNPVAGEPPPANTTNLPPDIETAPESPVTDEH